MDKEIKLPLDRFISPSSSTRYHIKDVLKRFYDYMRVMPKNKYVLAIGADSTYIKDLKRNTAIYVVTISLYRVGKGGIYFYTKFSAFFPDHFTRLYNEVYYSLLLLEEIRDWFEEVRKEFNIVSEVHIDIGKEGFSGKYYSVLKGFAQSGGVEVKTKPDSYASSSISDRYT